MDTYQHLDYLPIYESIYGEIGGLKRTAALWKPLSIDTHGPDPVAAGFSHNKPTYGSRTYAGNLIQRKQFNVTVHQ